MRADENSSLSLHLNSNNFEKWVNGKYIVVVIAYSKDDKKCPKCEDALFEFRKAKEIMLKQPDFILSKLNVDEDHLLRDRLNIESLPAIKIFAKSVTMINYSGKMKSIDLAKELTQIRDELRHRQRSGKFAPSVLEGRSNIKEVLPKNFMKEVRTRQPVCVMVILYKPECETECLILEKVALIFQKDSFVKFIKIDVTGNPKETADFPHLSNPTVLWFPADDKHNGQIYGGRIGLEILTEFINDYTGLARNYDGELKEDAGRIAEFDKIISDNIEDILMNKNIENIVTYMRKVQPKDLGLKIYVDYYYSLFKEMQKKVSAEKVIERESSYIAQQMAKVKSNSKQYEEWMFYRNIINSFVDANRVAIDRKTAKKYQTQLADMVEVSNLVPKSPVHEEL